MYRLTAGILDVSNAFQNLKNPIHEGFCVVPTTYYLYWLEIYYPNVPLNKYDDPFCLKFMNIIQGKKSFGQQWNRLLDAV